MLFVLFIFPLFAVFQSLQLCLVPLYLFVVYSGVVNGDLFTTMPLFDQIGRLDFGLLWISVMPVMTQCNDTEV